PPVGRQQVTVAVDTRGTWDNGETSQGWQGVVEVDASGRLDRAVEIGLTLPRFTWTRGGERIPLNGLHARATVTPQLVKLDELAVPDAEHVAAAASLNRADGAWQAALDVEQWQPAVW